MPEPRKSYYDIEFLGSPEARTIRMLCEYEQPRKRFRHHRIRDTIVFFGSARTLPGEVAEARLAHARAEFERAAAGDERARLQRHVELAERRRRMSRYYDDARLLARRITEWSMGRDHGRRYIVCTGGGPGIMEAGNRGAADVEGGRSVGLGVSLAFEERINQYVPEDLAFEFHYFFMRKYWFMYLAKAMVVFPGGFGTLDELVELLTLRQTRKVRKPVPVVLYGSEYWEQVLDVDAMLEWGTISERDLDLFHRADDVDGAFEYLVDALGDIERGGSPPARAGAGERA